MKGITGYLLGAVVVALLGGVCLAAGLLERQMARAQQQFAALDYIEPDAAFETAERYFQYGSRLPWIGNGPLNDVRVRRAALRYWQQQYGTIVPRQLDPVGAIAPDNIELQLVVANAVYRAGQAGADDRQAALEALDAGIDAYLSVLKNATRHEDAAYNYEYLVRLRDDIDQGRRPGLPDAEEDGPLGREGDQPVQESDMSDFKIFIPVESEELDKGDDGEAGKAGPIERKG